MVSFLPGIHLFQFISLLLRTLSGQEIWLTQIRTDARLGVALGFELYRIFEKIDLMQML